ncbi:hypothetical protein B0A58_12910 [Flavobacterium branchiophilum NBRC 15030 = ATCC 35035]|uniref:Uncharacterized protein n=1 Tax=Flavobacterium branchiophilum TaxID=55197 RepID=A0A543G3D8_9FLAO|nr:hypothetical protein [Flavobacterium branchiophilum]OXA72239.1 hypothetical protein B0A58_12910 [Flavobacterium branchiophilum NBRC 15030 = ATCC 35035]TQM40606.1 hypothetical protein BC670_1504 [Flavobacterium branchiophilum]GEM55967.1 hypothetical protein FB1_21880 [Flavobacterium branchiophilum NBRC 15030 = ATCC 35035]
MIKFHQIPTEKFKPLSHDKEYLFNLYEKIANFLAINFENGKNHKNKIAKPVRNSNDTDFYAPFPNLKPIEEIENNDSIVNDYWNFIEVVNQKIELLKQAKDENHKDWAKILTEVFNDQNNIIFSNGIEFCIVWGWQFENRNNYKPSIQSIKEPEKKLYNEEIPLSNPIKENEDITHENDSNPKNEVTEIEEQEIIEDIVKDNEEVVIEEVFEKKYSFFEFLKWFASNYWGLLLILAALIILTFLYKSIKYNTL